MAYFVPVILGTGREGSKSEKIVQFVFEEAKNYGFEVELIKPRDYLDKPFTGGMSEEKRNKLSEIFNRADGFLVVSPEYNHGYPGELKLLLDEFYEEYKHKPVGLCGVSSGKLGGGRMVEQLRLVFIELQTIPLRNAVYFSNVANFENEKENYKSFLLNLFDELKYYCEIFSKGRD